MAWEIEFERGAERELDRLDATVRSRILRFLFERVAEHPNPGVLADPLRGPLAGFVRWRVGDYRIYGRIEDDRLIIVIVGVGHRSEIYR